MMFSSVITASGYLQHLAHLLQPEIEAVSLPLPGNASA